MRRSLLLPSVAKRVPSGLEAALASASPEWRRTMALRPVATSQTITPSPLGATTRVPSRFQSTVQQYPLVSPRRTFSCSALELPQIRTVPSRSTLATRLPSGLNSASTTQHLAQCPPNVAVALPEAASQTRAVPSALVVTTRLPSALTAAPHTI